MEMQKLIVICGPTASGKTELAVQTALVFGGEIVSADSMQIYRGMDIGTAKPTERERMGIPHHMIDCVNIDAEYSVALYQEQARACIADIAQRGKIPILCGGTGLYISAVIYPLNFSSVGSQPRRQEWLEYVSVHGSEALHEKLAAISPKLAAGIHPNNVKRVIRALEVTEAGQHASEQQLFNSQLRYDLAWIGLTMPRDLLYRRIDARVDTMIGSGLVQEAKRLLVRYPREAQAFQSLGYKELFDYIDGIESIDDAVETLKRKTRNYAKRQLTWFRREERIRWFDSSQYIGKEAMAEEISGYIAACLHRSVTTNGGGAHE